MKKTPRKIQSNSDDTKISKLKKIVDKDSGLPVAISIIHSTHDHNGNPIRKRRDHRCFIQGLEGIGKRLADSQVNLSCDCEWFMYHCEFALSKKGNAEIIFSNGKPAKVTNPENRPQICKHLFHLAEVIIMRGM